MNFDDVSIPTAPLQDSQHGGSELTVTASSGRFFRSVSTATAFNAEDGAKLEGESLSSIFYSLTQAWMRETRFTNSMTAILSNGNLSRIVSLGSAVIPLILRDLERSPKHWFNALSVLTGADPVKEEQVGNMKAMREAWLSWGRQNRFM